MEKKNKQETIIKMINILVKQTTSNQYVWIKTEEGYEGLFGQQKDKHLVFSYMYNDNDEDEIQPSSYLILFNNALKIPYDTFVVINSQSPGYTECYNLFKAIKNQEENNLIDDCLYLINSEN